MDSNVGKADKNQRGDPYYTDSEDTIQELFESYFQMYISRFNVAREGGRRDVLSPFGRVGGMGTGKQGVMVMNMVL